MFMLRGLRQWAVHGSLTERYIGRITAVNRMSETITTIIVNRKYN